MTVIPECERCGRAKRQRGRYADWTCECCDESVKCPHVSKVSRWGRKLKGRKV